MNKRIKELLEKIRNGFKSACHDEDIEERFYRRLEDMRANPEKYQHILKKNSGSSKIPPVSLF